MCSTVYGRLDATPYERAVDDYVASEGPIALAGLLANIGPSGSKSQGAKPGIVVASPSLTDPDYVFAWIRDSALVFKALIDRFTDGRDSTRLPLILQYVQSQSNLQNTDNPSGAARGLGLAEPKFEINETAFTGAWGRPQRDGPALRSTALITLANWFIAQGNTSYVTSTLFPMITLDLNYVATYWNDQTFDLWEEVQGHSFFTTAVQHRALREGIALAQKLNSTANVASWTSEAANVLCTLQSYWQPSNAFILSNTNSGRSGIDVNSILTSVHTFSSNAGCDAVTFQPCSDKALAGHFAVVNSFRGSLYSINSGRASTAAVAIGRYKEDSYFGGNPWYLATFAAAEQLYLALSTWNSQKSITVTAISQPFFAQFIPGIAAGTYASTTSTFTTLTSAIRTYADGFIAINQQYTPANGGLAEQFSKSNGTPLSAVDLTWSYASALTAFDRRAGVLPAAWPAAGLTVPSGSSCGDSSTTLSSVTFNVNAQTVLGENIYLTGSVAELRNWSPDNAIGPLSNPNYPIWTVTVQVPANQTIEYKYIRKNGGSVVWESDPNRSFRSATTGGSVTLNDVWK
ncbi:glycoside hydrolase family 15 protein [Exidia glandulosa HHB12029]|uniref:Glucoamylase n=1 Tax=Exidia glandulosa HHB12029 TaxID=1314781 RepID=A0A166BNP2_EXIGL|nr:glycoside hydrolase family 15 protein [Exidia glandulosa HHB12029]